MISVCNHENTVVLKIPQFLNLLLLSTVLILCSLSCLHWAQSCNDQWIVCTDIDKRRLELCNVRRYRRIRRNDVVRGDRFLLLRRAFYLRKLYPPTILLFVLYYAQTQLFDLLCTSCRFAVQALPYRNSTTNVLTIDYILLSINQSINQSISLV